MLALCCLAQRYSVVDPLPAGQECAAYRGQQGGGDNPGHHVGLGGAEVVGDQPGQGLLVAGEHVHRIRLQRRCLCEDAGVFGDRRGAVGVAGQAVAAGRSDVSCHQPADPVVDRLAGRPVADRPDHRLLHDHVLVEEDRLFGGEVVEHGLGGDVGRLGDLRDGYVVVPALAEQPPGDVGDGLAGGELLALAQPRTA